MNFLKHIFILNVFSIIENFGLPQISIDGNFHAIGSADTTTNYTNVVEIVTETTENYRVVQITAQTTGKYYEIARIQDMLKIEEEKKRHAAMRQNRKGNAAQCRLKKYVKIEDQYGCQMCTCIYEKQIMLCSTFKCRNHAGDSESKLLQDMDPSLYNDYVIGVANHFSEFPCRPGQLIKTSIICECSCIMKDILSCPPTCPFGRPLN